MFYHAFYQAPFTTAHVPRNGTLALYIPPARKLHFHPDYETGGNYDVREYGHVRLVAKERLEKLASVSASLE